MFEYDVDDVGRRFSGIQPTDLDVDGNAHVSLAQVSGSIAQKLTIARKDLLDLGLRNPLLNYRPLRARGIEVVDKLSAEVFHVLVRQGKNMSFSPTADGEKDGPLAQPDNIQPGQTAPRHTDLRLQTQESSTKLQSRLLATYYSARTSIEEQGINTLFLALGMLCWHDQKDPKQVHKAPLLLIPVELERSNARERFQLHYTGDDLGANISLQEKLRADYGITLPLFFDGDDLDLNAYFASVETAIASQPSWKVERDAIALGFFSFAKLLMFNDLDPETWPAGQQPTDHPLLRALLGDGFRQPPSQFSDDDNLDQHPEPAALHPVLDSDSSQTLAVLDVQSGQNLVIQGPPGTGKSQTITNIIAEALANDKKVLFVAEKLAALEVVKRRLDKVGLGDACLELHSHNTQKRALLAELQRTLELGRPRTKEQDGDRDLLTSHRLKLNGYAAAMNLPIGDSSVTPYEALGQLVRFRQNQPAESLVRMDVPGMASWDGATFRRLLGKVGELQARLVACGMPSTHPWKGSRRTTLLPAEEEQLHELLTEALAATAALQAAGTTLAVILGVEAPTTRAEIAPMYPKAWQLLRRLFGKDKEPRAQAQEAIATHWDSIKKVVDFLDLDVTEQFGVDTPLVDLSFTDQQRVLAMWLERIRSLSALVAYNQLADECDEAGIGTAAHLSRTWDRAQTDLTTAFRFSWFRSLLERAYAERGAIASFNRESHELALTEFRNLDQLLPAFNSALLARLHWEKLPHQNGNGQLAVLKREFEKKARHLPIRQLMVKAGHPIQSIKPVFMMSPLSIANYLPPGSVTFDLVVFDEASQVRPVDAFGALLRGNQAVVVGDSRQLPPTSFFDSLSRSDEELEEEESITADIESVLGLFSAQLARERMLRWHYRSRHESLIAVSNHAFYQDRLVVFPSPDAERQDVGLIYRHLPQSAYDRGGTRTNPMEAAVVAQAVMEHARTRPNLSLGVAAFSVAQMRAIQDELEILRRQDPSCEEFFTTAHPHERFFVKNLETVQGDERDVIFISIGYGRTAEGILWRSFGPLNGDGGERRLNVLITRARCRCEVFTNLTADDIDDAGKGRGVRALKMFLQYARTGHLDVPVDDGREADSPFEEAVCYELQQHGYDVRKQVGSAGFRIDLAVVDPERPGRYLLGIECDGASYHSARTARDRDRLRQQILENLGWHIHRIWSTDWFRFQDREMKRLIAAIEDARKERPSAASVTHSPRPGNGAGVERENGQVLHREEQDVPVYKVAQIRVNLAGRDLHQVDRSELAELVACTVEIESPVHRTDVARRIADAARVQRVGSRIEAAIDQAILVAMRRYGIRRRGDFLWASKMEGPTVRNRSGLPAAARKLHLVAPEEIDTAISYVVQHAYGIQPDEIPADVCRLFGFGHMSDDMKEIVEQRIAVCTAGGALSAHGAYLTVAAAL